MGIVIDARAVFAAHYGQRIGTKPKKTIKASDNGEQCRVLLEDETRVLAESLEHGTWYLLQRTGAGHYTDVGRVGRNRVESKHDSGIAH